MIEVLEFLIKYLLPVYYREMKIGWMFIQGEGANLNILNEQGIDVPGKLIIFERKEKEK